MTEWQVILAISLGGAAVAFLYVIAREVERHLGRIARALERIADNTTDPNRVFPYPGAHRE